MIHCQLRKRDEENRAEISWKVQELCASCQSHILKKLKALSVLQKYFNDVEFVLFLLLFFWIERKMLLWSPSNPWSERVELSRTRLKFLCCTPYMDWILMFVSVDTCARILISYGVIPFRLVRTSFYFREIPFH